jgi:hypothetical protein
LKNQPKTDSIMANKVVKTVFLSAMILVASVVVTYAQEAAEGSGQSSDPILDKTFAIDSLDFEMFGKYARDKKYYTSLKKRFEKNDETLSEFEFYVLYYGYVYRDDYTGGYGHLNWGGLMKQRRDKEAYALVKKALKTAPAIASYLETAMILAIRIGRPHKEINNLAWRLANILRRIKDFGDGTEQSPWIVASVADEYTIIRCLLQVNDIKGQSLQISPQGRPCDIIEIEPIETELFSGSNVWFDVSFPYVMFASPRHWAKQLTGEDVQTKQSELEINDYLR